MKFAHDFDESLKAEEYPQKWLDSAISYRQLKRCIKKVERELQGLGLDPQILQQLWQNISNESTAKPYCYCISNEVAAFKPKLTVAIDPQDGSPMDARLSPETRDFLRTLPRSQSAGKRRFSAAPSAIDGCEKQVAYSAISEGTNPTDSGSEDTVQAPETVEIPLTSDSEFFQLLKWELGDLNQLHRTEQKQLTAQIAKLGSHLTGLIDASSKRSRVEVQAWREIFRRYLESQVFFSTVEQGAGPRSSSSAQKQLQEFSNGLADGHMKPRLSHDGKAAVNAFLHINASLLQFMKFQEINRTALTKIMKKFEKRTALHAQTNLPLMIANEQFISQDLAKAACFAIQEQLLPIVPQINDYLCPVCFSISFKPVKLRCNHVFCIRCLIVMQRAKQDHCPLCRSSVVMEASSENLDAKLMAFLRTNFPAEVKAKQKENQHAAGVDRYGEDFDRCAIM